MSEPPNQHPANWPTGGPPVAFPEQGAPAVPPPPYPYPVPQSYPLYPPPPELPDAYFPTSPGYRVDYSPYAAYGPVMMSPYSGSLENPSHGGGLAITGFVLGIVSLVSLFVFFIISLPTAIAGIIFSSFGLRKNPNRGLAIAGLVMSIIALLLSALLVGFILFVIVMSKSY